MKGFLSERWPRVGFYFMMDLQDAPIRRTRTGLGVASKHCHIVAEQRAGEMSQGHLFLYTETASAG